MIEKVARRNNDNVTPHYSNYKSRPTNHNYMLENGINFLIQQIRDEIVVVKYRKR